MILRIITPDRQWPEQQVEKVFLPGGQGLFEVLCGHAPIVSSLTRGTIRWDDGRLDIESGFVQVENDIVTAVVE